MKLVRERERRQRINRLRDYVPYAKQVEFHEAGAAYRERLFMAGNQLGKTLSGAAEAAMHLTGQYPDWWPGRRWDRPITMLAGSESYELTRDGVQRLLIGPPLNEEDWGTGYIPKAAIVDTTRRAGVSGTLDSVTVRHQSGGTSTILLKAYEQGRGKWQANTVDYVWFDEEPPEDVYFEGITRTNATGGSIAVTFTPLKGMSTVVARFIMPGEDEGAKYRTVTTMTIDDADHYSEEERARIIASYPAHEREARTKGVPSLGSGRIFPVSEESITVAPFEIPKHWVQIGGLDFGWDHPFGAAGCAWDRDADVFYVTKEYREREATPLIHSGALKPWGAWLPWSWPHDGLQHDKGSGEQLAAQYRGHGLNMLPERATFDDGTNGVEAGLADMLDRMQTGRFKVFSTCTHWFEEFRLYHRKDGKIVKERDDVISASRYALMMKRHAEIERAQVLVMPKREWVV
ncbi:terminase large subunit domain-containing protein [Ensifer adhaerens]|uniref:terminase large subunit domain-containing protein n=1 Tax=Ensifer adhaerens TaxID=106592 RepID=UPI003F7DC50E